MKKWIIRIVSTLTVGTVLVLGVRSYNLHKLTQVVANEILDDQKTLNAQKEKLQYLQNELIEMDSLEYIEKVAMEEWGMVTEDTIILKEKP